ncbi:MAG: CAP domain-containing protein [Blastocatellia bacterium]|nr:CAP domain-containing protein [Blastocatellia bacterium]
MKISNPPRHSCPRLGPFFITLVFIAITVLATAPSSFAQTAQGQPVARLISSSVVNTVSRPKRVADSLALTSVGTAAAAPSLPAIGDASTIERTAFDKTNEARVQNGLQPLAWDPLLCRMARMHSEDMAQRGYFAHETPEGLEPKDRGRALGILHFRVLAENIAYNKGFADPGAFAVERWMTSGGHRANILYIGFQASAIGSYVAADGSVYLTQVFITR